jgi:hypothetical protein
MQKVVEIANVIGGFGTLIVAWLVYQFGKQQAAQNDARAERQLHLDQQNLRLSMLDRRMMVLSEVRDVWLDYTMNGRLSPEKLPKLYRALQEAEFIYDDDLLQDLKLVATKLDMLERTSRRLEQARTDDERYQKLQTNQFKTEDELWPILDPLLEKMRAATRVQELK